MSKLGNDMATTIEWFGARLICIASDFNRYDEYAIKQIDRNIELMRYKYFSDDLLLLELVNTQVSSKPADLINNAAEKLPETKKNQAYDWTLDKAKSQSSTELMSLFNEYARRRVIEDDVTRKDLKLYTAFKRIKNIACVSLVPNKDLVWLCG